MEWFKIDTAPRDGSQFLAYDPIADEFDVCIMQHWSPKMGWRVWSCQIDGEYGPSEDEFNADRATIWSPLTKPVGRPAEPDRQLTKADG